MPSRISLSSPGSECGPSSTSLRYLPSTSAGLNPNRRVNPSFTYTTCRVLLLITMALSLASSALRNGASAKGAGGRMPRWGGGGGEHTIKKKTTPHDDSNCYKFFNNRKNFW